MRNAHAYNGCRAQTSELTTDLGPKANLATLNGLNESKSCKKNKKNNAK